MMRRNKSATLRRRTKSFVDERLHFQKMSQLNHEIDKFKRSLESIRPKTNELKCFGKIKPSYSVCSLRSLQSLHSLGPDVANHTTGSIETIPTQNLTLPKEFDERADRIRHDREQYERMEEREEDYRAPEGLAPIPILLTSEYSTYGNYTMDSVGREEDNQSITSNPVSLPITIPFVCSGDESQSENHTFKTLSSNSTTPPNLISSEGLKTDELKDSESIEPNNLTYSIQSPKSDVTTYTIDDNEKDPPQSFLTPTNGVNEMDVKSQHDTIDEKQHEPKEEQEDTHNEYIVPISLPIPIPSESLIDESYATDGIDINNFMQENHIKSESETMSPCSSTQSELRTVIRQEPRIQQIEDDFEFIITPTIMVNVMDTLRSNLPHQFDRNDQDLHKKSTEFHRESQIAVTQQMSILIKKQSKESMRSYIDSSADEHTEGSDIINQVFSKKPHDNFVQLQKYFLKWIHFTTLEKLKRRNPAQTRLQKMEAFLQNITFERKRALNKLRRPGNIVVLKRDDGCKVMDSPRLLNRTFNNK